MQFLGLWTSHFKTRSPAQTSAPQEIVVGQQEMGETRVRYLLAAILGLSLASCSTIYRTPKVVEGVTGGTNVRVLDMTAETVVQANMSSYAPQTLPAYFSQTSGTGSGLRGDGTLPTPPLQGETRPNALELRLPPPADPGPYMIGVGDVVLLATPRATTSVEQLSGLLAAQNARQGYTVQDDGSINIPDVGRVRIAGLTIEDAEAALFQKLVENQIDPTFSLEIAEFNSRKVSIGGAVSNPTVVPVTLTPLYLEEVLAAAGGITVDDLDYASIRLYRDGTLYQIPLTQLYSQSSLTKTRLVSGDAIFVDTEYNLARAQDYFAQQITLAQVRQSSRQNALQALQLEVALRRSALQEARDNYKARIELGADNRRTFILRVKLASNRALPCRMSARRLWLTRFTILRGSRRRRAMYRRFMCCARHLIRANSGLSPHGT